VIAFVIYTSPPSLVPHFDMPRYLSYSRREKAQLKDIHSTQQEENVSKKRNARNCQPQAR